MTRRIRLGKRTHPTTQPPEAELEDQCGAEDRKGRSCHRTKGHRGKHQARDRDSGWLTQWNIDHRRGQ